MLPQGINVCNVEDESTPTCHRLTMLQVKNGGIRIPLAKRREARPFTAIKHLHAEHVPIKLHGRPHVAYTKRHCRNLFNMHRSPPDRRSTTSLPILVFSSGVSQNSRSTSHEKSEMFTTQNPRPEVDSRAILFTEITAPPKHSLCCCQASRLSDRSPRTLQSI